MDYLTDLRAARAARVNSARTETSPTRSIRRRSPEGNDSLPPLALATGDSNETMDARRREQEEVLSLRLALEKIDLRDEESLSEPARDEALESMLKQSKTDVKEAQIGQPSWVVSDTKSATELKSADPREGGVDRVHFATPQTDDVAGVIITATESPESPQTYTKTFKKKGYQGLARAVAADIANSRQRISSGSRRKASASKNVFPNARDKIYEEPAASVDIPVADMVPEIPRHIRKNPFARVKFAQDRVSPAASIESRKPEQKSPPKKLTKVPLPSDKPSKPVHVSPQARKPDPIQVVVSKAEAPRQDSEIGRGEFPTGARGTKQIDRSPQVTQAPSDIPGIRFRPLRSPNHVNDNPSRPVSRNQQHIHPAMRTPSYPQIRVPSLPSIAVPVDIPTINVSQQRASPVTAASSMAVPTISFPGNDEGSEHTERESPCMSASGTHHAVPTISIPEDQSELVHDPADSTPTTTVQPRRPVMQHAATLPSLTDSKPYLPPRSAARSSTLCSQCALPISGRVLSAAGERLHPECFNCHQCSTNLECVAFYPEPDQKYYERVARIQQRLSGLEVGVPVDMRGIDAAALEEKDGDDSLRYFCHLDFHELFSPRCKSCKTPIEGEVVVACGAEWHVGHFFCAQCGDVRTFLYYRNQY